MGRQPLEDRKINKSGRFNPFLLETIEQRADKLNFNFSQTLEYLSELGSVITDDPFYKKLEKLATKKRKSVVDILPEILAKGLESN